MLLLSESQKTTCTFFVFISLRRAEIRVSKAIKIDVNEKFAIVSLLAYHWKIIKDTMNNNL